MSTRSKLLISAAFDILKAVVFIALAAYLVWDLLK